ncbi:uncharacterized protein CXQ87_004234 [Candidozyma duobushaemuli]|uniref:Alpha/beta hydrolase fold-3 domain-containing protein n=2 Tax=Candidozyma TaxID=3303203 RepID=A0ABX8I7C1_9ASCO|nr:uncharacterized protein CXQ87_004234 [[Candida] duobushaemulonis]PVH16358.1 hypothetical protein CXQ87_004234 [[Candida] duobushaemulonis]QWU88982.1 hypothetical protein CA3LBN_003305 [[Candida] haemuloni]
MKLSTILILSKLPFDFLVVVLRYFIFGGIRARKYRKSLANLLKVKLYRTALSVPISDSKWLAPYSNDFLIQRILPTIAPALTKNVPGYGERYDSNSIWLVKQPDRSPDDPIIFFLHGGGFFLQTMPQQLRSVMSIYHLLDPAIKKKTSVLLLDYKLASKGHTFPTQMLQLDQSYQRLVQEGNKNIIMMGDSAGGNLAVGHTQFLKAKEEPVQYPTKLLLISPWVKLAPLPHDMTKQSSWKQCEDYDLIHHSKFADISELALIIGERDAFSLVWSPMGKTPRQRSDWSSIPNYSDPKYDVLVLLGEDESFRDDILEWSKYALDVPFHGKAYGTEEGYTEDNYTFERRNEAGHANLSLYVEPQGLHDAILFFEDTVHKQVGAGLRAGKPLTIKDVDSNKFFGIYRMVKFLNERL